MWLHTHTCLAPPPFVASLCYHTSQTPAIIKHFQCIVAVDDVLLQGDSLSDDATFYPVMQIQCAWGCHLERSLKRLPKGMQFLFPFLFLSFLAHCALLKDANVVKGYS